MVRVELESLAKGSIRHFRRYAPLYVIGLVWVVMIAIFPSVGGPGTRVTTAGGGGELTSEAAGPDAELVGETGEPIATTTGAARRGGSRAATQAIGTVAVGTGVTRGGVQCRPGVRQLPFSQYANPCVGKFEGFNGGNTFRGVSKDTIRIAMRAPVDPNAETVEAARQAAGQASNEIFKQVFLTFVDYFNKTYELYDRKVVVESFTGQGNAVDEAQSKGRDLACRDATAIAERGYFGVIRYPSIVSESEPFSDCASQQKLFVPTGANYFPEQYYQRWNPYVWAIRMECERIARQFSEYLGKRLWQAGTKARWAGDPVYRQRDRKIGVYVPNNDGYQRCVNIAENILKEQYGITIAHRINYTLDVAQFPNQAASAVVQFKDAQITTLINACDTISTGLMMDNAVIQGWQPEWVIIGVDSQDTDGVGRRWESGAQGQGGGRNRSLIEGHLFGPGQLGNDAKLFGKDEEAAQAYRAATGKEIPAGSNLAYFIAVDLFNKLQAAGPVLTSDNLALGMKKLPPASGATGAWGTWFYGDDHTATDDSREVYWSSTANGFDGRRGTWLETYGGKRFSDGQWPLEQPPIYP